MKTDTSIVTYYIVSKTHTCREREREREREFITGTIHNYGTHIIRNKHSILTVIMNIYLKMNDYALGGMHVAHG